MRRFTRPGAVLIQLNPLEWLEQPVWNRELPEALRLSEPDPDNNIRRSVEHSLSLVDLAIHSCWAIEVPEVFESSLDLYRLLTFGCSPDEVPTFEEVSAALTTIFQDHAVGGGLTYRNRCFLWKAIID